MSRRPDHIPTRKPFPKSVKAEVLKRSKGMCEAEGCTKPGKDFDHVKPIAFGGESTLENCQLLCRECNAEKGIQEGRDAAKADRQGGRSGQYARRQRAKPNGTHRPIRSPGFSKPEGYVSPLSKESPQYKAAKARKRK